MRKGLLKALESNCCSLSDQGFCFLVREQCLYTIFFFKLLYTYSLNRVPGNCLNGNYMLGAVDIHCYFSESGEQGTGAGEEEGEF